MTTKEDFIDEMCRLASSVKIRYPDGTPLEKIKEEDMRLFKELIEFSYDNGIFDEK